MNPVRELATLRRRTHSVKPQRLTAGSNLLQGIRGELFEIEAVLKVESEADVGFDLRGVPVVYNASSQKLSCLGQQATVVPRDGSISLRIFVDRCAVDIFGDDGRLYMPMAMKMAPENRALKMSCNEGYAEVVSLSVHELKSAW